jgi:hypothetical protein
LEQGTGVDDAAADGFVEGGASGWDEMVPNVDATHGSVSMRCGGRVVPWQLERRIELGEGGVRLSYAALTPYVGVWVCNGDLGGYRQVSIEPATGGNDRPDPAAPPPLLEPREQFRWWLEVRDGR